MRTLRERPRVVALAVWITLALVAMGALVGATASRGETRDASVALQSARVDAQAKGRAADGALQEAVGKLKAQRKRVSSLKRELIEAKREARRWRTLVKRGR